MVNTTCAAFAQLSSFPHSKSLFIIENSPFQDLKPYTNYSSAYSGQSQISLFWPIHELPTPLTIQSRIRRFVWEDSPIRVKVTGKWRKWHVQEEEKCIQGLRWGNLKRQLVRPRHRWGDINMVFKNDDGMIWTALICYCKHSNVLMVP